jgi:pilus assembly protein CpaF
MSEPSDPPTATAATTAANELKTRLDAAYPELVDRLASQQSNGPTSIVRQQVREALERYAARRLTALWQAMSTDQQGRVLSELVAERLGYDVLEGLLRDPSVSEIMVNGPFEIFVERHGCVERTPLAFRNRDCLMAVIERMLALTGRRVSLAQPCVDARLADGCRVNVAIGPVALDGPTLTIRKPIRELFDLDRLIRLKTLSQQAAQLLRDAVLARLNLLISGRAASGKTTLMNALADTIGPNERIVIIEETAELQLAHHHVTRLETRLPNVEGLGEVNVRQLVRNALHMRPDRLLVGEVRGEEALDLLLAMTSGHDGSMATVHASSAAEALDRLSTMALLAGPNFSSTAIERQVHSAIHMIVHIERDANGSRRVTRIAAVAQDPSQPLEDLFVSAAGQANSGNVLLPTPHLSRFLDELHRLAPSSPLPSRWNPN